MNSRTNLNYVRQNSKLSIIHHQRMKEIKQVVKEFLINKIRWLLKLILPIQRRWREGIKGYPWFDEVWNDLYIGGVPYKKADYLWIVKNDIRAVLNISSEWLDDTDFYNRNNISHLNIPVKDLAAPSQEHLGEAVRYIRKHINRGEKILVHCAKGRGRSATMICAYLAQTINKTPLQVISEMKKIRPLVSMNEKQIESVTEYLDKNDQA